MKKHIYLTLALVVASVVAHAQTWTLSGPTSVCPGAQNVSYTLQSSGGGLPAGNVYWSVNGQSVPGNGFTNQIDFPSGSSFVVRAVNLTVGADVSLNVSSIGADPGTISLTGGSCNGLSLSISVSGNSGSLKWQRKVGTGPWADYGLGFPDPLGDNNVSVGTEYSYRVRTNTSCATQYSNVITTTLMNPTNAGTVSGAHTICYGSQPSQNLTGSTPSGGGGSYSYSWSKRVGAGSWQSIGGGSTLSPSEIGTLTQTTEFKRMVTDSECGSDWSSNTVTITVDPLTVSGSVSGTTNRCGTGSGSYSISGYTGTIKRWQSRYKNGTGSWTGWSTFEEADDETAVNLTLNQWNSGQRTYEIRAVIRSGVCNTEYATVQTTVDPVSVAGTITGNSTRCNSGTENYSISGHTGTIQRWQYRTKDGGGSWSGWSTITETDDVTSVSPTLSYWSGGQRTYEVRATVKSGNCTTVYATKQTTVDPPTVSGSITGNSNRCGSGSENYSISGYTGTIERWESRYKNGSGSWTSWFTFEEADDQTAVNLTLSQWNSGQRTYEIRATIKSGVCNTEYATVQTTVDPVSVAGSITGNATKCGSGTEDYTLTGYTGTIERWQSRYKNGSGSWTSWSTITETDDVTNVSESLTQWNSGQRTYQIRATIKSGSCSTVYAYKQTAVDPVTVAGSVSGNSNQCGSGSASYSITGHTGTIERWETRYKNGSGSWTSWFTFEEADDQTNVSPTLSQWNSGQRTYEIRATIKSGVCNAEYATVQTTVDPVSVAGSITGNATKCGSGTEGYTLTGYTGTIERWESRYKNGTGSWTSWSTITETDDLTSIDYTLTQWNSGQRTYETRATIKSGSCAATYASLQTVIDPGSVGGTVSGTTEEFGIASGSVSLSGHVGNVVKWQYKTTGAWMDTLVTNTTLNYVNVQTTTQYRARVTSGVCDEVSSTTATVTILEEPSIDLGVQTNVRPGSGTTITADAGHANYQWFKDDVETQNGASNQLVVTHPGQYRVTVTSGGGAVYQTGNATIGSQLDEDRTYVMVYDFRESGYNGTSDIFNVPMEDMSITADIYDGLGRPLQKINMEGSPDGSDLVAPIEYDALGRQQKSYLPYASTDLGTLYKPDALGTSSKQKAFYDNYNNGQYYNEKAFSENKFEASPLNRVVEQGLPGNEWAIGQHSVKMEYQVNESTENITKWSMNGDLPQDDGDYGDGKLFKSITTDENGNQTITYTNFRKEPILIKKEIDSDWAQTYYIYDERNRLRVVLQPEGVKNITDYTGGGVTPQQKKDFLAVWAFQYGYDAQNRQIKKQVPGADPVYTVYDVWDRVRMTRDGVQGTLVEGNYRWSFIKYDVQNRPIVTGIQSNSTNEDQVDMTGNVEGNSYMYETYSTSTHTYSDNMFPATGGADVELLTVTFYDTYDFLNHAEWVSLGLGFSEPSPQRQYNTEPRGQVTGTKTKVSDDSWIYSTSFYDEKGRLIQARSTNHLGGVDVVSNHYNFANEVVKTITTHDDEAHTIVREFTYDHRGRLLETTHAIDGAPAVVLAANTYNELDEVAEKRLHSTDQSTFEQYVNYEYNIRRWLTKINESDLSSNDPVADLFGMELYYETNPIGPKTFFNGNISAMRWSNYDATGGGPATRAYAYDYDKLSRLKMADHFEETANVSRYDVSGITYDFNGNILSLTRANESGDDMDDLTYGYGTGLLSNQLVKVDDAGDDAEGFTETGTGDDYTYDANGNMIVDNNKGITAIEYNHLNLPLKVEFATTGDSIVYLYDAAGIKLRQTVYEGGSAVKTTDYVGEFIYENDTIRQIQHEEGRLVPWYLEDGITQGGFDYQYHLKDHLGNARVTFEALEYHMVETFETGQDNGFYNLHRSTNTNANTTVGGDEVELLAEGETGAMVFLRLKKGDEIDMSVNANYETNPSNNNVAEIAYTALFSEFTSTSIEAENSITANSTAFDDAVSGGLSGKGSASTAPRAFLNYIVFDTAMNYEYAGFAQISTAAYGVGVHETIFINDYIAEEDGFILIYLTNENQEAANVHFDDFTVHQQQTNVIQADDYYPFGLTFNSYQAPSARVNNFKYNSFEYMEDLNLNLYDYQARYYDPAIGRFIQSDPAADLMRRHSPYNYAFDNPLKYIDPDGMMPDIVIDGAGTGSSGGSAPTANGDLELGEDPIFDLKGNLIGDDGKNNGAIHVVTDKKQAKTIAKSDDQVTDLTNVDHVTLNGGESTVKGVETSVNASETDGLHEEGGHTQAELMTEDDLKLGTQPEVKTVQWEPGKTKTGTNNASIPPFNGTSDPGSLLLDNWHTHTSNSVKNINAQGQEVSTYAARGPSPADKRFAASMNARGVTTLQIDTRGSNRVNFVNSGGSGIKASMKMKNFIKLKN